MDQACDDDGVTRVRDSKEHRAPDVAIAQQIGRDRCSHHPDDDSATEPQDQGRSKFLKLLPQRARIRQHHRPAPAMQGSAARRKNRLLPSDGRNNACTGYQCLRLFCSTAQCPLHAPKSRDYRFQSLAQLSRQRQCRRTIGRISPEAREQANFCFSEYVSSPKIKNISLFQKCKSGLYSRHPVPTRGASAIVTNEGRGCGGRGWSL